ncbi:hypothetical protein [Cyclobacterium jeungdonense]|uniref:Uncharacterized protein n=1 Tax=Cyclobacterium jeungdonense TaxID=708087 RepID=A0ABT8C849_9BACT|nr:hypothetical protein [Cyclobacterium jeungdonense]MDN3688700.1 hypothetical protein [Cyclobacterium jeungdonense]
MENEVKKLLKEFSELRDRSKPISSPNTESLIRHEVRFSCFGMICANLENILASNSKKSLATGTEDPVSDLILYKVTGVYGSFKSVKYIRERSKKEAVSTFLNIERDEAVHGEIKCEEVIKVNEIV